MAATIHRVFYVAAEFPDVPNMPTPDQFRRAFRAWRHAFRETGIMDGNGLIQWLHNERYDTRYLTVGSYMGREAQTQILDESAEDLTRAPLPTICVALATLLWCTAQSPKWCGEMGMYD